MDEGPFPAPTAGVPREVLLVGIQELRMKRGLPLGSGCEGGCGSSAILPLFLLTPSCPGLGQCPGEPDGGE